MKLIDKSQILLLLSFFVFLFLYIPGIPFAEENVNSVYFEEIFGKTPHIELLLDGKKSHPKLTFTEGPSWVDGKLYFSNYYMFWKDFGSSNEGGLCLIDKENSHLVLNKDIQTCGTKPLPNGNILACDLIKRGLVEFTAKGKLVKIWVDSFDGKPLGMPNDLCMDSKGGVYFTDPIVAKKGAKQPGTAIYYLTPEKNIIRLTGWNEYIFPNGCVISRDDRKIFVNDSLSDSLFVYDILENGELTGKRVFAELKTNKGKKSMADGMTIDFNDNIYVATSAGIQVFKNDGGYIGTLRLPETPSNCTFGGAEGSILFATCRDRIYSVKTNVRGLKF